MPRAHAHGAGVALAARRVGNRRRMVAAAGINAALLIAEVLGGILTGSLALLADAGHVFLDLGSIGLAILAAGMAARPGGARRTFGYQRGEVIAALVNGLALIAIAIAIVVAAVNRLGDPPSVAGAGVLVLGVVGFAGDAAATWMLAQGGRDDINLEAALRHTAADAVGSLGVACAGAVILATGWTAIDPIVSIAIAGLILLASVKLVREPLDVLMEAAPPGVDVEELGRAMCDVRGIRSVHDLHVWSVTPGFEALAAHVVVARGHDRDRARRELEYLLRDRFALEHTTLQMEEEGDDSPLQVET